MDLLNSILNNIDEALIVTDAHGKILFFNEVALKLSADIFDKPLEEGVILSQVLSFSRKEIVHEIIHEIQQKKQADKSFAEYLNRDGATVYLESSYIPVINEEGELTYIHIFTRDITSQKIFEKKLTFQAANISNLIDKANAIIIGVDTRGYITEWNEYCSKVTGFDKDEVYTQKLSKVLLTKEEKYFDELLAKVLIDESVSNYEIPVRTKSGKTAIFLLNGTHRTTPSREVTGILFVGQDITELTAYRKSLEKKVEERTRELQQAIKKEKEVVDMKSRFISIASHEFRTPLSSISFATDFIERSLSDEQLEMQGKIENIRKQIKHMTHLLDDVLTYGKSEAGKIELIISSVVLEDFFTRIIEEVSQSTNNTHTIETDFVDLPKTILSDEKLLRNIIINLLTNAIKFSPNSKKVFMEIQGHEDGLVVSVRDEGIGIPPDELSKIFDPFIRGRGVTFIQGTGLGLSIVKKAVELLDGTIEADSRVGAGTTFTVKMPFR